jgi:hypothetical protein
MFGCCFTRSSFNNDTHTGRNAVKYVNVGEAVDVPGNLFSAFAPSFVLATRNRDRNGRSYRPDNLVGARTVSRSHVWPGEGRAESGA